jgi:hypothetical protein
MVNESRTDLCWHYHASIASTLAYLQAYDAVGAFLHDLLSSTFSLLPTMHHYCHGCAW